MGRCGLYSCCVFLATFLTLSEIRTTQGQQPNQVELVTEPDAAYYVVRKQPANITCEAYGASKITFTCAGSQIPPSSQRTFESYDDPRGQTLVRSTIQVSRSDVANYVGGDGFWCECSAWSDDSTIAATSSRAVIALSYMKKKFVEEPVSQTATVGSMVVFNCIPPNAEPFPEILWRKDGKRISKEDDDNFQEGADGSLTIVAVRQQDAGSYECIARNDGGRRESSPAVLTVTEAETKAETTVQAPKEEPTTTPSADTARPRSERDSSKPVFYEEPAQNVYVTPTEPVQIICDVKGADILTLRCNGQRVDREKLDTKEDRATKSIRSVLNLTYAEVENYKNLFREDKYQCECLAWYTEPQNPSWQFSKSAVGSVFLAYLNQDFQEEPRDMRVQTGTSATIICSPPEGKPDPWVYWIFEQQRLDPRADSRYIVGRDGSLTIHSTNHYDNGRYYCVAENAMGMRQSRVGTLTVSDEPVVTRTEPPTVATTARTAYVATFPAIIPQEPVFTRDLDAVYYLNSNGEATLITSVVSADMLTYRCNGERLQAHQQVIDVQTDRASSKRLLTATTVVTQQDIEDSQAEEYACQAYAWYILEKEWKSLTGTKGVILPAYLEANFPYEPESGIYYVGDTAEFACQAPMGKPQPTVSWSKNGVVLDPETDDNLVIMGDGTLIVESVRFEDAGEYICVATNTAGSRRSRPAMLELDAGIAGLDTTTTTPAPPRRTTPRAGPTRPRTPSTTTQPATTTITTTSTTPPAPTPPTPTPRFVDGTTTGFEVLLPIFTLQPPMENYIVRDQPVTLTCGVVAATVLVFNCNGERIKKEDGGYKTTDPQSGYTIIEKNIIITREQVEAHDAQSNVPFTCQCRAYYKVEGGAQDDFQYVPSDDAIVMLAYFKRNFEKEPVSQIVELGVATELQCQPPQGSPPPTVHWLKDGFRLVESNNHRVTEEGSLIIESVAAEDTGNYTCAAQNILNTRYSRTISVSVMDKGAVPAVTDPYSSITMGPGIIGDDDDDEDYEDTDDDDGTSEPTSEPEGGVEGEPEPDGSYPPAFVAEPEASYYIIKSNPVTIVCQARGADRITFNCNAENIPESRVQYLDSLVDNDMVGDEGSILAASIDVSREEVENFNNANGGDNFWCQCYARYMVPAMSDPQYLASSKGYVQVAYLKRAFRREPFNVTVEQGEFVSLPCEAPEGNPVPEVYWMFNGERVSHDLPSPDGAYIIGSAGPLNAGTYVCVAENIANKRMSRLALISVSVDGAVVTGAPIVEGGEPEPDSEPTPEAEYGIVTAQPKMDSEVDMCIKLLQKCSSSMPIAQKDQRNCDKVQDYSVCMNNFLNKCTGILTNESLSAARTALEKAEKDCTRISGECQEMRACESEYSQQSVPNADKSTMPMVTLCAGIHTFLRCADRAAGLCKIPMDNPKTSLTDLATWFEEYCQRVVEDDWAGQCTALSKCDLPISQATVLANLVQSSLWCPYVQKTMKCTREAVTECELNDVEDDLDFLSNLSGNTCTKSQGMDDADDDDEDDNDNDDDEDRKVTAVAGAGETKESTGENSGWSARASLLLTSLVPVMFVLLTCR